MNKTAFKIFRSVNKAKFKSVIENQRALSKEFHLMSDQLDQYAENWNYFKSMALRVYGDYQLVHIRRVIDIFDTEMAS